MELRESNGGGEKKSHENVLELTEALHSGSKACAHLFFILICKGAGWGDVQKEERKKERKKERKNKERRGWSGVRKAVRRKQHRTSRRSLGKGKVRDEETDQGGKEGRAMNRYLFWRPPSPPRSSEKFLQFHQHRLKIKKKSKRKGTQPNYHRVKKESENKRVSARLRDAGGVGGCGGAGRENDGTLFSPLLLMATNLIICLHSGAAETCSLTYTLTLAHSTLSLSPISPLTRGPDQALLRSNPQRGGPLVS